MLPGQPKSNYLTRPDACSTASWAGLPRDGGPAPARSHENETQAEPHAHAEVEAHPRDFGPPVAPAMGDPSALERVSQPFHHREIADAAVPRVPPAGEVHGNVYGQHQKGAACARHHAEH